LLQGVAAAHQVGDSIIRTQRLFGLNAVSAIKIDFPRASQQFYSSINSSSLARARIPFLAWRELRAAS
jgi:hypothetical protein